MNEPTIRVAVVGCGVFGLEHLDALTRVSNAEVAAVCDPNVEVANRAAELFRVPRVCSELPEVLTDSDIDAVIVAAPSPVHAELARQCLAAGKHVLIEKPVTMSAAEAEQLVRLADRNREVIVLPGHVLRHSRPHRRIQSAIADGEIGSVLSFVAARDRERGHHDRYSETSPTFLTMIHDIDLALWMTGQHPTRACAFAVQEQGRAQPSVVTAIVHTEEGSHWAIRSSWALPRGADNQDRLEVIGTAGTIAWSDRPEFDLTRSVATAVPMSAVDRSFPGEIDAEVVHFVECVRAGQQSTVVGMPEAAMGIRLAEAIDRSWRTGGELQDV